MIYSNQNSIPFGRGCFLFSPRGWVNSLPSFYYIRSMKKLFLLLFLISSKTYCQEIPFKIIGGDIEWQKVFDEDLNIEPQTIFFRKPSELGGQYINTCQQADLYVDKKDGKTRLRVRNFLFKLPPLFPEFELVASVALTRKGFKKSFINININYKIC